MGLRPVEPKWAEMVAIRPGKAEDDDMICSLVKARAGVIAHRVSVTN